MGQYYTIMEQTMNDYSCDEILSELLTRFRMTNGIETCATNDLNAVAIFASGEVMFRAIEGVKAMTDPPASQ